MKLRVLLSFSLVAAALTISPVLAQSAESTKLGDEKYEPRVGQSGKDVIWVPTNDAVADAMLKVAKVKPTDIVYDLGAGDGKIAIAAAKNFGATAFGIEYNKEMAELARRNTERAGVSDKVKIINGDIFVEDFSKATVVTMYLLPDLNLKIRPTILKMAPGTRVVTNSFNMGDWEPDDTVGTGYAQGYFWIVPGNAAGKWTLKGMEGSQQQATLELTQRYQRVGGVLNLYGKSQPILGATLSGNRLKFTFLDHSNQSRIIDVTLNGNEFSGQVLENSALYSITGTRAQ
ncbi:MAG: methyltransferase domain-containing protein [Alcaligenaceae bacterium]|jgi:SAM-dependent methyltransferase